VGEESLNVLGSVVLWAEVLTPVLGTQVRRRIGIMHHVSSGVAGCSGASDLLLVARESSRGRGAVSQLALTNSNFFISGMEIVMEKITRKKVVKQNQDFVQAGAPGDH
jgi:hypothetical protein